MKTKNHTRLTLSEIEHSELRDCFIYGVTLYITFCSFFFLVGIDVYSYLHFGHFKIPLVGIIFLTLLHTFAIFVFARSFGLGLFQLLYPTEPTEVTRPANRYVVNLAVKFYAWMSNVTLHNEAVLISKEVIDTSGTIEYGLGETMWLTSRQHQITIKFWVYLPVRDTGKCFMQVQKEVLVEKSFYDELADSEQNLSIEYTGSLLEQFKVLEVQTM